MFSKNKIDFYLKKKKKRPNGLEKGWHAMNYRGDFEFRGPGNLMC